MCGDKPWNQADRKTLSVIYLSLGTEGKRIVNPHLKMDTLTTVELWSKFSFDQETSDMIGICYLQEIKQKTIQRDICMKS